MQSQYKTVGITGGSGLIGQRLAAGLRDEYDLVLYDKEPPADGTDARFSSVDLADAALLDGAFEGIDALVHLAARHRGGPSFHEVLTNNIVGTYNVLEEARRAGVRKIVFASTNHVQNGHASHISGDYTAIDEQFAQTGKPISLNDPPAPDSYYGVSKLFGEDLGRYYACFLKTFQFISVRIGWAAPENPADVSLAKFRRSEGVERHYRALYLSHADCIQIFHRAIETDIDYAVAYAISDNPTPLFDLTETKRVLGYHPTGDAETYFDAVERAAANRPGI